MMESVFLRLLDMSHLSSYCIVFVVLIRLRIKKSHKSGTAIHRQPKFSRLDLPLGDKPDEGFVIHFCMCEVKCIVLLGPAVVFNND